MSTQELTVLELEYEFTIVTIGTLAVSIVFIEAFVRSLVMFFEEDDDVTSETPFVIEVPAAVVRLVRAAVPLERLEADRLSSDEVVQEEDALDNGVAVARDGLQVAIPNDFVTATMQGLKRVYVS